MDGAAWAVQTIVRRLGGCMEIDGSALLRGDRVDARGPHQDDSVRILSAADGRVAINLPRGCDWELVPAWLDLPINPVPTWADVAAGVQARPVAQVASRAGELGLAVAPCPAPGAEPRDDQMTHRHPTGRVRPWVLDLAAGTDYPRLDETVVIDLSALWAGPLLGALLAGAGAGVTKVEDPRRRDASHPAPTAQATALNDMKMLAEVPFSGTGIARLATLVDEADIVIEGSRPRVLDALGLGPAHGLRSNQLWISITAYGRSGPWSGRTGFGDDTAAAAGLYDERDGGGHIVGDAVADPLSGLHGAVAALAAVLGGHSGHIDVALRDAAVAAASMAAAPRPPEDAVW